ncbi:MAG: hypothetical protein ACRD0B_04505 [Acidimicrobiales bacterium]
MTDVSCRRCGRSFETAARRGGKTSCPSCRSTVYVAVAGASSTARPRKPEASKREEPPSAIAYVLRCGHLDVYLDEDLLPGELDGYLFTCQECGAEDQEVVEVLGSLSRAEAAVMGDGDFETWCDALGMARPA